MRELERAEAIALRVQPVTETSLLVTWYTREFGKLKTLAKGARRPKSPLRGKIDLFYEAEIVFLRSGRSDLHLLSDCYLVNPHRQLRTSVAGMAAAAYACELVEALTAEEDRHVAIHELLRQVLGMVARAGGIVPLLWFELQVLAEAGWRPEIGAATGTEKVLRALAEANATTVSRIRLTSEQVGAAQTAIWQFRDPHLDRRLRSQKLLLAQIRR